jgi:wyosine [tRNA(Phe)-imidazoG37] synthetase (radical SAM superfamily)
MVFVLEEAKSIIAFGPVPSRRLGRSLGINNIPAKICTYSCIYCQLGSTIKKQIERRSFYKPERIFKEGQKLVEKVGKRGEKIDYLTFVPDGEPTLDIALGEEISLLRALGTKIAVITNGSLIDRADVRRGLSMADLVSLKIDALSEDIWRVVDRPHVSLNHHEILDGMILFAHEFKGDLITETMLIHGVNDNEEEINRVAEFLVKLKPVKAYVAIPTRPPAENWVKPASQHIINLAYQKFSEKLGEDRVEYLIGYEGDSFASTGDFVEDLISITSVHPMREDALENFLKKANSDWSLVYDLIKKGKLVELEFEGHKFYMRKLPSRKKVQK